MNSASGVWITSKPFAASALTNFDVARFTTTLSSMLTALHAKASASSSSMAIRLPAGTRDSIAARDSSSNAGG